MHRPFLLFALGVLLPAVLALVLTAARFEAGIGDVREAGHRRAAQMTAGLLARDPGEALDGPAASATLARVRAATGYDAWVVAGGRAVLPAGARIPAADTASWPLEGHEGVSVVAAPSALPGRAMAPQAWLVATLLLVFTLVAGWILLTRGRHEEEGGTPHLLLVSLLPLGVTIGVLTFLVVDFDHRADAAAVESLAEVFAVVRDPRVAGTPEAIRALSGLHATRVVDGRVAGTTLQDGDAAPLGGLRLPPPGFTTSGRVEGPAGQWLYLARRDRGRSMTVLCVDAPPPVRAFRLRALLIAALLTTWILAFTLLARPRHAVAPAVRPEPSLRPRPTRAPR